MDSQQPCRNDGPDTDSLLLFDRMPSPSPISRLRQTLPPSFFVLILIRIQTITQCSTRSSTLILTLCVRPSMRERSVAAAQQPAVRQRVAGALQRVLDTLVANLDTKARAYKNKARTSSACF